MNDPITDREYYSSDSALDPSLRAGILYAGYGDAQFGVNSEGIRHVFQNVIAHDILLLKTSAHFKVLDIDPTGYFSVGRRSPYSLYE